jgi:hypothetical protein
MIRELFNTPVVVRREARAVPPRDLQPGGQTAPARDQTQEEVVQREGAFVTVQSLASFPGAVAAVLLIVHFVIFMMPSWTGSRWLYIGAAVIIGLSIYAINEGDPKAIPKTNTQRALGIGIAILNTFVILSSAVAIDTKGLSATGPQQPQQQQGQVQPPAKTTPTAEANHG